MASCCCIRVLLSNLDYLTPMYWSSPILQCLKNPRFLCITFTLLLRIHIASLQKPLPHGI